MADNITDILWLAGLLEGEGCFHLGHHLAPNGKKYPQHSIRLSMSDLDVVERAATILDVAVHKHTVLKSGKTMWRICVYGQKAIKWMHLLYPHMGSRRRAKIDEILAFLELRKAG